ncbi:MULTISPECIES: hypothetical protein [Vibrio]|uniref:DUF3800 domain-containing protein n=1 Tax=Vibrio kanaloae TaxID=170673 RepID=A0ABV4LKK5_9VIBR|nr:hypothetical protein [Vibrio kanaloae]OEF14265.1 hypothetical protein A132_10105 [Vibrio kanaloae 5S-149]
MYKNIPSLPIAEGNALGIVLDGCIQQYDKVFDTAPFKSFAVYSDYSGKTNGKYHIYSFLFTPLDFVGNYYAAVEKSRMVRGLNRGELSFKKMGHNPKMLAVAQDALRHSNNLLPGLLVNVVVDKKINTLFSEDQRGSKNYLKQSLEDGGFLHLPKQSIETALRIAHIFSFLTASVLPSDKPIFWMSDNEDDFYPSGNEKIRKDFLKLLDRVLPLYMSSGYDFINFCTQGAVDVKWHRELVSLVDLSAAGLNDIMTSNVRKQPIAAKSEVIGKWLSLEQGLSLQKMNLYISMSDSGIHSGKVDIGFNGDKSDMVKLAL